MAGFLTKGIKLSYKTGSATDYTDLTLLQEVPEIGGTKESVEVTTLDDSAHMFIAGLISYGDSISFKFLHDKTQFNTLAALTGEVDWKVSLPDGAGGTTGTTVTFSGEPSVKIDSMGVNAAMTYTLDIKPTSAMTFA